jgi:hypothetical protein
MQMLITVIGQEMRRIFGGTYEIANLGHASNFRYLHVIKRGTIKSSNGQSRRYRQSCSGEDKECNKCNESDHFNEYQLSEERHRANERHKSNTF